MRDFSFVRRRPGFIDLVIPKVADDVTGYGLEWAQNFDGAVAFASVITATNHGHIDADLQKFPRDLVNRVDVVRIIFNPKNYSIDDTKSFWLRFVPYVGAVAGTPGNPGLILPDAVAYRMVVIQGKAPSGATVADSLHLDFPRLMTDFRIVNLDSAKTLFVATEDGGPEYAFMPTVNDYPVSNLLGASPYILVRGDGAEVEFTATFTAAYPK